MCGRREAGREGDDGLRAKAQVDSVGTTDAV